MMLNQTLEKMRALKLWGMLEALENQQSMADVGQLPFETRLGLLIDREENCRNFKRTSARLKAAKLKDAGACIEDLDFKTPRSLDKAMLLSLAGCDWIRHHQNVIITGPTGVGKGFVSSALVQRACMEGMTALFIRIPRLFSELALARVDGRYYKLMATYARADVVIFDDWGQSLSENERRDFLEIVEDRYGARSTIITSQVPPEEWPTIIGEPTMADAIMDRLLNNAHRIAMTGPSMRKLRSKQLAQDSRAMTATTVQ